MTAPSAEDLQTTLSQAQQKLKDGRVAYAEARQQLRSLLQHITNARSRGSINKQIWDSERALGLHHQYHSQAGQDSFLDQKVFGGKDNGVFVEIGGYDGVTGSNCLFFETIRGWTGILIEPSPTFFAKAERARKCACLQLALSDADGEAEFMDVQAGFSQMSGLTSTYDPDLRAQVEGNPNHKGDLITVQTRTLAGILAEQGLKQIDYVSLDVEGGEMSVLSTFPFDEFDITAWTIENNTADVAVPRLMADKGYRRVEAIGVDDVYVKSA